MIILIEGLLYHGQMCFQFCIPRRSVCSRRSRKDGPAQSDRTGVEIEDLGPVSGEKPPLICRKQTRLVGGNRLRSGVFSLSLSETFFVFVLFLLGSGRNELTRWGTMRTEREGSLSGIHVGRYYCEISASTCAYMYVRTGTPTGLHIRAYTHPAYR